MNESKHQSKTDVTILDKRCDKNVGHVIATFKKPLVFLATLPIYFYRIAIKPWLPSSCKFYPTCSEYTIESIKRFGIITGWKMGLWRIMRCQPLNKKGGYDPVPYRYAGGAKWVI